MIQQQYDKLSNFNRQQLSLTSQQLSVVYGQMTDFIDVFDDEIISQIFSGNNTDVDTFFELLYQETIKRFVSKR